jgi:hypothetical protein
MLSRLILVMVGIALALLGAASTFWVWRDALCGTTPPDANSMVAFAAPMSFVFGVAMAVFRYDQLMMPNEDYPGRKTMTRLGWAMFLLALVAGVGNFALLIYVLKKD